MGTVPNESHAHACAHARTHTHPTIHASLWLIHLDDLEWNLLILMLHSCREDGLLCNVTILEDGLLLILMLHSYREDGLLYNVTILGDGLLLILKLHSETQRMVFYAM